MLKKWRAACRPPRCGSGHPPGETEHYAAGAVAVDAGTAAQLRTGDGLRLAARWWAPSGPARAAVVLVHGFTGSSADPPLLDVAAALAADGMHVLAYDGRGHGASEGLCTLGDLERHDVAAAVAAARERHPRVVTVGASMGGVAVLRHAVGDPGLAGVVTVSSPARWQVPRSWRGLLATGLTQTPVGRRVSRRYLGARLAGGWDWPQPPVALAAALRCPLAVVHGRADRMVGVRAARELHAAAGGPVRLDLVAGMGHAYTAAARPAIGAAVQWALGARQSSTT